MAEKITDSPGVIAPPPLLFAVCILAGLAIDYFWPLAVIDDRWQYWIGGGLLAAGLALTMAGVTLFGRAGTHVPTYRPTTALVTSGPYGFSRNPIYVGLFLAYLGIGALADSGWIMALAAPLFLVMNLGVVAREEVYLERKFGKTYRDYKSRVRRWL